jgi:hypothetical protein
VEFGKEQVHPTIISYQSNNKFNDYKYNTHNLGGHDVTFIHPKSAVGVLVELVQAPEDLIKEYNAD